MLPTTDVGEEEIEEGGVLPALCQGDQEWVGDGLDTGRNIREGHQKIRIMIKQDSLRNRLFTIIQFYSSFAKSFKYHDYKTMYVFNNNPSFNI